MMRRKHIASVLAAAVTTVLAGQAMVSSAAPFTPGNVVLYRVGAPDAAAAPGNAATAVFLDEYAPSGTLVQTIALPTTAGGANRILTANGNSTSEGMLNRSADGRYLLMTGYEAPVGTAGASATTLNRVVGRVDAGGLADTSTVINYAFLGDNVRSAASTNGTDIWVAGTDSAGAARGIYYTTFGSTTGTQVVPFATRDVAVYGGQLFGGTTANSAPGKIFQAGTGTPTGPATATALPGTALALGGSANQFVFLDLSPTVGGLDTLYVADNTSAALSKYSLVGGVWTARGLVGTDGDDYSGLTAIVSDDGSGAVTLFATRLNGSSQDELVRLVDASGYGGTLSGTPTVLAQSGTTAFRGLALAPVPEPTGVALVAIGGALLGLRRRRS